MTVHRTELTKAFCGRFGFSILMAAVVGLLSFSALAQSPSTAVEKIFVSDFEEQTIDLYPRIEFVGDRGHIFASASETRTTTVQVYDAVGNLISDPDINWSSSDGTLLSVSDTGPGSAQLTSVGTWDGTISYEASYPALGLSATGQATMADLAPQTVLIPSAWVLEALGDRFNEHTVVLTRNSTTETFAADDVIVSGTAAGVSVRILGIEIIGDEVRVSAVPASVEEAFEAYSSTVSGESVRVLIQSRKAFTEVTAYSSETGQVLSHQKSMDKSLLDVVECDGGLNVGANVRFEALDLEIDLQPKTVADINLNADDLVEIGISGSVRAVATLSVNVSANATLEGQCTVDLPNLSLPGVPLYIITLAPRIDPNLEVRASAVTQADAGWVPISGLERTWLFNAGVRYTKSAGWGSFKSFDSTGAESESGTFSLSGTLNLEAEAGVNVGVGFDLCLTACSPITEFANAEFIQLFGGPYWRFSMVTPLDPADPSYQGPQQSIGVGAEATAGLDVSFFESGLLKYLPIGGSAGINFPVFSEQIELIGTPSLGGSVSCVPDCVSMPSDGGTLNVDLTAASPGTGTAEFWMGSGESNLSLLGTAAFDAGQAKGSFFTGILPEGNYKIYPRLQLNNSIFWFTSTFPFGSQTPIGFFNIMSAEPPPLPDVPRVLFNKVDMTSVALSGNTPMNIEPFKNGNSYYTAIHQPINSLSAAIRVFRFGNADVQRIFSDGSFIKAMSLNYVDGYIFTEEKRSSKVNRIYDASSPFLITLSLDSGADRVDFGRTLASSSPQPLYFNDSELLSANAYSVQEVTADGLELRSISRSGSVFGGLPLPARIYDGYVIDRTNQAIGARDGFYDYEGLLLGLTPSGAAVFDWNENPENPVYLTTNGKLLFPNRAYSAFSTSSQAIANPIAIVSLNAIIGVDSATENLTVSRFDFETGLQTVVTDFKVGSANAVQCVGENEGVVVVMNCSQETTPYSEVSVLEFNTPM